MKFIPNTVAPTELANSIMSRDSRIALYMETGLLDITTIITKKTQILH